MRSIVQHCGFLSKYDSPWLGKRKLEIAGKKKTQFLLRNDVTVKVILRDKLSGERQV